VSDLDFTRAIFRKSIRSEGGYGCIEAATLDHHLVRDSKNHNSPVLAFSRPELAAFIIGVKSNPPTGRSRERPHHGATRTTEQDRTRP
jgi:hypothetical protein